MKGLRTTPDPSATIIVFGPKVPATELSPSVRFFVPRTTFPFVSVSVPPTAMSFARITAPISLFTIKLLKLVAAVPPIVWLETPAKLIVFPVKGTA